MMKQPSSSFAVLATAALLTSCASFVPGVGAQAFLTGNPLGDIYTQIKNGDSGLIPSLTSAYSDLVPAVTGLGGPLSHVTAQASAEQASILSQASASAKASAGGNNGGGSGNGGGGRGSSSSRFATVTSASSGAQATSDAAAATAAAAAASSVDANSVLATSDASVSDAALASAAVTTSTSGASALNVPPSRLNQAALLGVAMVVAAGAVLL